MGTILQEIGHDAVITAFINQVIRPFYKASFAIITPAIGPKRDIWMYDSQQKSYFSCWNLSKSEYIPEFYYRMSLKKEDLAKLDKECGYRHQKWYLDLKKILKEDPKKYLSKICRDLENKLYSDLPDIICFDSEGKLKLIAEIKFEGFSTKAKISTIKEYDAAKSLKLPYILVIPKKPSYGSEITSTWIKSNLPSDLKVYKFEIPINDIVPKQNNIIFQAIE